MDEDGSGWVFDSLICFLNGPVWSAPLESFIEEKSLIFETNVEENPEYRKIYNEFKNLVDFMLGNFMEDMGITPQQFEEACAKGTQEGVSLHFDQNIFEQIWAANDYEIFKKMMTQRNVELQLQALELIEQKYGITPESFIPHKNEPHHSGETEVEITPRPPSVLEKEIMKEVVKQFPSPEPKSVDTTNLQDEVQHLLKRKDSLEKSLKKTIEDSSTSNQKLPSSTIDDTKEKTALASQKIKHINLGMDNIPKKDQLKTTGLEQKPAVEVDTEDLKKRQAYLRTQRDKLVALKKEARKKHLQIDASSAEKDLVRPQSAKKAAQTILEGDVANIETQQLQIRKALVEKFKSEVISNKLEN